MKDQKYKSIIKITAIVFSTGILLLNVLLNYIH